MVSRVVLSGMHSGANPSPGLGIARSLRVAGLDLDLIGLDYSPESSGLHSSLLDSRVVLPGWKEIDLDVWVKQVGDLVGPDDFYVSSLDLEVRLVAQAFGGRPEFLSPTLRALEHVAKPPHMAAAALEMASASSLMYDGNDDEIDDFVRNSRAGVWVKGQHYEAVRAEHLGQVLAAGRRIETLWGGSWHVERHVPGQESGVAFAAREGVLLGAVMMRKSVLTADGKTWAGTVSPLEDRVLSRLRAWVSDTGWHGGGELELIEGWDSSITLMEINPRFPAWIHGASLTGANLPAALVTGQKVDTGGGSFTRVIEELATDPSLGAPAFPWSSSEYVSAAAKHPSGMPDVARRALVTGSSDRTESRSRRGPSASHAPVHYSTVRTPALHIDPTALVERLNLVRAGMPSGRDVRFCYSIKTNPDPRLVSAAINANMLVEAISQEELTLARSLSAPPSRLVLNGPAKWWPAPVEPVRAHAVFIDSIPEFQVLAELLDVGIEIKTQILGLRLSRKAMASRFGVTVDEGDDLVEASRLLRSMCERLKCQWGVHFHTTESVVGVDRWVEDCTASLRGASFLTEALSEPPALVDFGGGWHMRDLDKLPSAVARVLEQVSGEVDVDVPWLFELGKSLLEPCGTLLTRVIVGPNSRGDVVVDAGLSDLPEGPHWPHPVTTVATDGKERSVAAGAGRILGRTCMERDVLAVDLHLADLRFGDLIAIGRAGGYDASMAYPFARGRRFEVIPSA